MSMPSPAPKQDRDHGWAVRYTDRAGIEKTTEPQSHKTAELKLDGCRHMFLPKANIKKHADGGGIITIDCLRESDAQYLFSRVQTSLELLSPRAKLVNLVDEARAEAKKPEESLGAMETINRQGQKTDRRSDS